MTKRDDSRFSPPALGGVSLLVAFAVLCLTVFALLSLSTVRADTRLSDASARAVQDYYAADCAAQEILARLRNGEEPDEVAFWGVEPQYAEYAVSISETQELQVEVALGSDGSWQVLRWQAVPVGDWEPNDDLNLWDGE